MSDSLTAALQEVITTEISSSNDPVEPETDLLLGGLVDSLGVIRIVDWLERRLDIEIDPVDVVLENFRTIADMVAYASHRTGTPL